MSEVVEQKDNSQGLRFEIFEDCVIFDDPLLYPDGWVQLSKQFIEKLSKLLEDDKWKCKLTARHGSHFS